MSTSQGERKTPKLGRSEEPEQIKEDDDLPELVTDSEGSDLEDNKLPELGTGKDDNKPKPAPRRARPPARPHRELKPRELKLPELPTGKPPLPSKPGNEKPRRRFTQGIVTIREVRKYRCPLRPISPVDPSAPGAPVEPFDL